MNASETPATETTTSAKRKRRTSFSLLTFLLLLTIVALGISHVRMMSQLNEKEKALAATQAAFSILNKEAGYMEIKDPSLIHVVSVPTQQEMSWHWQVYVPHHVKLRSLLIVRPSAGTAQIDSAPLRPGMNEVELQIYRFFNGSWKYMITVDNGETISNASYKLPADFVANSDLSTTITSLPLQADQPRVFPSNEDIVLMKMTSEDADDAGPVLNGVKDYGEITLRLMSKGF